MCPTHRLRHSPCRLLASRRAIRNSYGMKSAAAPKRRVAELPKEPKERKKRKSSQQPEAPQARGTHTHMQVQALVALLLTPMF